MRGLFKTVVAAALPLSLGSGTCWAERALELAPSAGALAPQVSSREVADSAPFIRFTGSPLHPIVANWEAIKIFEDTSTPSKDSVTSQSPLAHPNVNEVSSPPAGLLAAPVIGLIVLLAARRPSLHAK